MRIQPTRTLMLIALFLAATAAGWLGIEAIEAYGASLPRIPWTTAMLLGLLALGLVFIALDLKKRIELPDRIHRGEVVVNEKPKEINPIHAARMVVLAKAASHGGAVLTGLYLGFALYLLPDFASSQRRSLLLAASLCALLSLLVAVVGMMMERILRLPEE